MGSPSLDTSFASNVDKMKIVSRQHSFEKKPAKQKGNLRNRIAQLQGQVLGKQQAPANEFKIQPKSV